MGEIMILENGIPSWVQDIDKAELWDDSFVRIVDFFVLHSPNTQLSVREKSLSEYHWSTPWRKPYWLNKQLKRESSNYNLLFSSKSYKQLDEELLKSDLLIWPPLDLIPERLCFVDNKKNQFISVFYHIRNSIAHGRFNLIVDDDGPVFIFEDVAPKSKLSARMIIRKNTLLKWIDLIESGEKEYEINN